jgi:hypothetical protein
LVQFSRSPKDITRFIKIQWQLMRGGIQCFTRVAGIKWPPQVCATIKTIKRKTHSSQKRPYAGSNLSGNEKHRWFVVE